MKKPWLVNSRNTDPYDTDNFKELLPETLREMDTHQLLEYAQAFFMWDSVNTTAVISDIGVDDVQEVALRFGLACLLDILENPEEELGELKWMFSFSGELDRVREKDD